MPKTVVNGTPASEVLRAPNHADCIVNGNGGDDTIYGGFDSREELRGGPGDDVIFAGYSSRDSMWGGDGNNKFVFANPSQSPNQGGKRAVIHDFKATDRIEIFWATAETCSIRWEHLHGDDWRIFWDYTGDAQGGDMIPDMAVDVEGAEPTMANFTFGSAADYD